MAIDWHPVADLFRSQQRFVITSHVRPDADALGSEIGLLGLLEGMGKEVRIINPSATPPHLKFLDPDERVTKIGNAASVEAACQADVHIILDTSAWVQVGDMRKVLEKTPARKVIIDHHVSSDDLGATEYKDVTAAATGVLITELAQAMGYTPTGTDAIALYAAIATDTGWFRFPNTDARTLEAAAWLIDCGVKPSLIYSELYERSSLARLKLHAKVLERVALAFDGRLAHTSALRKDFDETRAHAADTEDLVNVCLTIAGTECAFILIEQMDGRVKASLRSRSDVDVAQIAERFQGGGHRQAAGAMLKGPLPEAEKTLLETFAEVMNGGDDATTGDSPLQTDTPEEQSKGALEASPPDET